MSYQFGSTASITYGDRTVCDGAQHLTVSYWIWPSGTGPVTDWSTYIGRIVKPYTYTGWSVGTSFANPRIPGAFFANDLLYGVNKEYGSPVLTEAAWNHVLVTYDGTQLVDARVRIWVNRTELTLIGGVSIPAALGTISGGADLFLRNDAGTVWLAEVGIWVGTAITSSTVIDQLGAASAAVAPPSCGVSGLSFYLPLREDATETVAGIAPTIADAVLSASHPPVTPVEGVPTLTVRVNESQLGGATF